MGRRTEPSVQEQFLRERFIADNPLRWQEIEEDREATLRAPDFLRNAPKWIDEANRRRAKNARKAQAILDGAKKVREQREENGKKFEEFQLLLIKHYGGLVITPERRAALKPEDFAQRQSIEGHMLKLQGYDALGDQLIAEAKEIEDIAKMTFYQRFDHVFDSRFFNAEFLAGQGKAYLEELGKNAPLIGATTALMIGLASNPVTAPIALVIGYAMFGKGIFDSGREVVLFLSATINARIEADFVEARVHLTKILIKLAEAGVAKGVKVGAGKLAQAGVLLIPRRLKKLSVVASATQRRNSPGSVTGGATLPPISGKWLQEGVGGYVPQSVANKLRGKRFATFDDFRNAFWKAVADDHQLAGQFSKANQSLMRRGYAPKAPGHLHHGEIDEYQLHHIEAIERGGPVYDVDNLIILAPKPHKGIHDPQVFVPGYTP